MASLQKLTRKKRLKVEHTNECRLYKHFHIALLLKRIFLVLKFFLYFPKNRKIRWILHLVLFVCIAVYCLHRTKSCAGTLFCYVPGKKRALTLFTENKVSFTKAQVITMNVAKC